MATSDRSNGFAAGDVHVPAAATAAVVTLAAVASRAHVIHQVHVSYGATPTGGRLTITDGGVTVFDVDVPAAGAFDFTFDPPKRGAANSAVVVTLASGGGAVQGKIGMVNHTLD